VIEEEKVERDDVVERDPAHPLPAAPDAPARAEAERRQHRPERPAARVEDDAGPEGGNPQAEVSRREGRLLPREAHLGQEAGARRRRLVEHLVAAVAVPADRRRRDEGLGPL
jgi:hypothetical protein